MRLRAGLPRPLPRADHVGRVVHRRRTGSCDYPLDYLLRFLDNHGLIGVGQALQWRTITGGSMRYVERIVDPARAGRRPGRRPGRRRRARAAPASTVRTAGGTRDAFDAVVMATHADDALALLHDADPRERRALAGFEYTTNRVVLHTDERAAPPPAGRARLVERGPGGLPASRPTSWR